MDTATTMAGNPKRLADSTPSADSSSSKRQKDEALNEHHATQEISDDSKRRPAIKSDATGMARMSDVRMSDAARLAELLAASATELEPSAEPLTKKKSSPVNTKTKDEGLFPPEMGQV
eukprot:SAG11_NODE_226_length_12046_cov_14.694568_2_plen_118_part_00